MKREWQLLRRERVAVWALLALVLLVVAAAVNSAALLGVQSQNLERLSSSQAQLRAALAEQAARGVPTATDPGVLGYSVLSEVTALPPAPLASFGIGQNDLLPNHYEITARGAHNFLTRGSIDNAQRLATGNFDVAFVIVWLLPLVAIALAFNIVSGERERGVLALAVAAGRELSSFILGKWGLRLTAVVTALFCALGLAAGVAGVPLGRAWPDWVLWFLTAALYVSFWFALALAVNVSQRSSDQNAALLVGVWLLTVIVAPTLTNLAATTIFAAPSRVVLTTELREATEAADQRAAQDRDQYFFDHPEMRGQDMDTLAYYRSVAATEADIAGAMQPLLMAFDLQAQRQQNLVERLQYLSPGTLVYQVLTSLSGSDGRRHRELKRQMQKFHSGWVQFFNSRLERGARLTPADYTQLPRFVFQEPSRVRTWLAAAAPLTVLVLLTMLLLWWARRRLQSLSVV
jgi:ABC-2 type transport system permease protein